MAIGEPDGDAARLTLQAFDAFNTAFQSITRRARQRFEEKDWQGVQRDAIERLDLYEAVLDRVASQLDQLLGARAHEQSLWTAAKEGFAALAAGRYDIDRAETFFNSVTRKMLKTVGINREVEFFYLHPRPADLQGAGSVFRTYARATDTRAMIREIVGDLPFGALFEDLERDAGLVAQEVDLHLWPVVGNDMQFTIDVINTIFFRNKAAYVVGRICTDTRVIPLVIPLVHGDRGVYADTVLLSEADAGIVFSFAYSYFLVDVARHDALIGFLGSLLPHAELAGLYNSLGYNRHGKTEFYRELHRFVHVSREQFVIAPGVEGAVMIVFTLPNFNFVFKVIKDRPCFLRSAHETPKAISNEQVKHQYNFVSHRDRAGRMVDTQEFENLRFKKKRFSDALLGEFTEAARNAVLITDDYVIIRHVYVQRKVVPMPLYFRCEEDPETIRSVLVDFGYFLKDLAASGVFPCDLFNTWNYGVTQWGRVVLFDYDDVLPIEQVTFREKPLPRHEAEEFGPEEEWIVASPEDFFMDEMDRYSGIPAPLKGVFNAVHADLYTLRFWNDLTHRLHHGEIFDVVPYDRTKRFRDRPAPCENT